MKAIRVGILGCGKISDVYFKGCRKYPVLEVVACADLDRERATVKAAAHGVRAMAPDHLVGASDIDLVVNLTVPQVHATLNRAVLEAGKHVYCEKPFALDPNEGLKILELACVRNLLVGCAPDTFFGSAMQTVRSMVDQQVVGAPVAALAFMLSRGPERWHPSPAFFYQKGGGPLFDMGPYYLAAMINLFGPAVSVNATAQASYPERTITSQPFAGTRIPVDVCTHYAATVRFANGALATLIMSFDVWPGPRLPAIAIYGQNGTIEAPDPNYFDGVVYLWRAGEKEADLVASSHPTGRARGVGVADLAYSILRRERPPRASGAMAQHVLEIMAACGRSAATGTSVALDGSCSRPAPLPGDLPCDQLDS